MGFKIGSNYHENLKRLEDLLKETVGDNFRPEDFYFLNDKDAKRVVIIGPTLRKSVCYKCVKPIDDGEAIQLSIIHLREPRRRETYFFHFWHYI